MKIIAQATTEEEILVPISEGADSAEIRDTIVMQAQCCVVHLCGCNCSC